MGHFVPLQWCVGDFSDSLQKSQVDKFFVSPKKLAGFERYFSGVNLPLFSPSSVSGHWLEKNACRNHSVPMNTGSTARSRASAQGMGRWGRHPRLLWGKKTLQPQRKKCVESQYRHLATLMELLSWHFILSCCYIKHYRLKHLDELIQLSCVLLKCLFFPLTSS